MERVLWLPENERRRLSEWARAAYPQEACGLLLGKPNGAESRVISARLARNVALERLGDRYEIDPPDYLAAEREAAERGLEVVGVWHTHPDHPARPSATDLELAWGGWSYLILAVTAQGVADLRSWRLRGEQGFDEEVVRS